VDGIQTFQLVAQMGFRLETADEIRLIGEFRLDNLYCDFPINEMLLGTVYSTKAPSPVGCRRS
jgi:hypothetical protein